MTGLDARLVCIEGRVQGVWFRAWTAEQAKLRGLAGWVRNRRDGSVEALFAGPGAEIEDMVRLCRHGPPAARVTAVKVQPAEAPDGDEFRQLPSE